MIDPLRSRHHRMGVRAAAGLHRADLDRPRAVADVEDADAAEAVAADVLADPLPAAIDPAAGLLDRHDEKVADDRQVALPARANHRALQLRDAAGAEPVEVEAVVAAGRQQVAGKRHVGVGEAQMRRAGVGFRRLPALGVALFLLGVRQRLAGRVGGVEEAGRLGQAGDQPQVADRLAGVVEAGRQRRARVGRKADEQLAHPLDLGLLLVDHVVDEIGEHRVVRRAGPLQQVAGHLHRALVVGDHPLQELPVELGPLGRGSAAICCGVDMPGMVAWSAWRGGHRVAGMVGGGVGRVLAAVAQPILHELDLVFLRSIDPLGRVDHLAAGRPPVDQRRHLHRLVMVVDHVLHELDVVGREARVGDLAGFLGGQRTRRLARARRAGRSARSARRRRRMPPRAQRRRWRAKGKQLVVIGACLPEEAPGVT